MNRILRVENTNYLESFTDWKSEVNILGPKAEWQQRWLFPVVSGSVYFQACQPSEAHHVLRWKHLPAASASVIRPLAIDLEVLVSLLCELL